VPFLSVADSTGSGKVQYLAMQYHAVLMVVHHVTPLHLVISKQLTTEELKPMQTVMLRKMKKNQSGIIRTISVAGELGRRLREMGLTPGTEISVCGRAPLKDPVAIRVLNSILTLRNNEAEHIHVEVHNHGALKNSI